MQLTNALYDKLMANPFIINNPKAIVQCLKDLLNSYDKRNITNYLPPEEVTNALQDAQQKKVMAEAASGFQDGGQPGGPGQQGGGANGGAPGTK
jgi:type II secretory pathway component GspD/PulD (secretin)